MSQLKPVKEWLSDRYNSCKDVQSVEALLGDIWECEVESRAEAASLVQYRANNYITWLVDLVADLHLHWECIDPETKELPETQINLDFLQQKLLIDQARYISLLKDHGLL